MAELMLQQGRTPESIAEILGLTIQQVEAVLSEIRPPAVVLDQPEPQLVLSDAFRALLRNVIDENATFDFVRTYRDGGSGVTTIEIEFDERVAKLLPGAMRAAVGFLGEVAGIARVWREDVELIVIEGDFDAEQVDIRLRSFWKGVSAMLA